MTELTLPLVEVAAGVLLNKHHQFLLTQRPPDKTYAGYWEFAGGKIEEGETTIDALSRELNEELGIKIIKASYWFSHLQHYDLINVQLHFYLVEDWFGEVKPYEGQQIAWSQFPIKQTPLLEGTKPAIEKLRQHLSAI